MKYQVLVLCFTLSFGFIELSHLNKEQPSYLLLFKSGTKRDSQAQLKVEDFQSTNIPLFKVKKKREPGQLSKGPDSRRPFRLRCLRNVTLPYIPPIEFGRKRETTNALMKKQVGPPYIPPIEFGRKRESRQHLKEKLRTFRSKWEGSMEN